MTIATIPLPESPTRVFEDVSACLDHLLADAVPLAGAVIGPTLHGPWTNVFLIVIARETGPVTVMIDGGGLEADVGAIRAAFVDKFLRIFQPLIVLNPDHGRIEVDRINEAGAALWPGRIFGVDWLRVRSVPEEVVEIA